MITRFRVEGRHFDKEKLTEQLFEAANRVREISNVPPETEWEITDDRVDGRPGNYKGRMVFVASLHN